MRITCDNQESTPLRLGRGMLFVRDYECSKDSMLTYLVKNTGNHKVKLQFREKEVVAHNDLYVGWWAKRLWEFAIYAASSAA
ncbi:MAG: hypothetical protein IT292_07270 [Deltaproteobacteria bacterium]|nr:hypothetical protein [Deltaproteobacteria bacterium]